MAARHGGVSPERGVLAKREDYDPPILVQQGDCKLGGAHRALDRRGGPAQRLRRRGPAAKLDGARGPGVAGRLPTPGFHGSVREGPAREPRGSAGTEQSQERGIAAADRLTSGGVRRKSKGFTGRGRGCGPGEACWSRGRATAGLAGARMRRCGVAAAAQGALRGRAVRTWSCGAEVTAAG